MLKIFRQVRSTALSEKRMARFWSYALGEILLLVIGILIALQINNWNEDRKERKLAATYLDNLELDLQAEALAAFKSGFGLYVQKGLKIGMLISLLILPLYMPVLIFGSAAVKAAALGNPAGPHLAILGGMLCLAVALAPGCDHRGDARSPGPTPGGCERQGRLDRPNPI